MRYSQSVICLLLLLALVLPRIYYVESFAVPLPFWDQWDSEWLGLLKPWIEGKWTIAHLFAPHNEHRIIPTRLLTLATFIATGSWNNVTEARVNIPLSVLSPALLLWFMIRSGSFNSQSWLVVVVILMGSSLPFSWENFLIGFQSQFYFFSLFTISALALAAHKPHSRWAGAGVVILCLLSILTVASGVLTAASVIAVILARAFVQQKLDRYSIVMVAVLAIVSIVGYAMIPPAPAHETLHARNAFEFFKTATRLMGWPLRGSKAHMAFLWFPGFISLIICFFRRRLNHIDLLFVGCFVWSALQILALAYGRGHDFAHMPPRYSEVLLPGLAASSWFVLKLPAATEQRLPKRMLWMVATAFFAVVFFSYIQRTALDMRILKEELGRRQTQTANVCQYLKTKDFSAINKPGFQIPYPDPEKLQLILDDPKLAEAVSLNALCGKNESD